MKLVFVCKRRPQQRDLVSRPYGRFFHIPRQLSSLGHEVHVLLIGHGGEHAVSFERDGISWHCVDLRRQHFRALSDAWRMGVELEPDWVVGCSDAWVGIIATHIAGKCKARLAIDAYDNFEAYMPWNLPLHLAWRRSVAAADVVTAAGPQLALRLDTHRRGKSPTAIVPMAADPSFRPLDPNESRTQLGLPADAPLIGYMGGWARNRGTDVVLDAFRRLRGHRPDARLVLTGRPPPIALAEPGVIPLGYIDDAQIPVAMSALDVACIVTADSSFGRYSYPAKLCEAMACRVPVVATATKPVCWMLQDDARFLVPLADASALARRVAALLDGHDRIVYPELPSWNQSTIRFEAALTSA